MLRHNLRFSTILLLAGLSTLTAVEAQFSDVSSSARAAVRTISGAAEKRLLVETMGGGICVLDFDQDGFFDLFFVNGLTRPGATGEPGDFLLRNDGKGAFDDVTTQSGITTPGWGMGCVAADYDNDGDTDLYVTNFGPNVLYRNEGNGRFSDVTARAGVGDSQWSTGAAFGDFDGDGDLDLYVANYVDFDYQNPGGDPRFCSYRGVTVACGPRGLPGAPDTLYRNDGGDRFVDVSEKAGIRAAGKLYGFQPVWTDFDEDGDPDIFVANDSTPNFLWINDGDGTFTESALLNGVAYNQQGRAQANMGVDIQDVDGDGLLDIYSTNFSDDYNVLYRNAGNNFMQDHTFRARIAQVTFRYLGFGAVLADFDNDGRTDIFSANGHIYPEVERHGLGSTYRQLNQLFLNQGNGELGEEKSWQTGGMAIVKSSRGAALLDYDNDGDLDLAISNMDDTADLLRNDSSSANHYLQIALRGSPSNRQGIGTRIQLIAGDLKVARELHAGSSFLGNEQPILHFGLGEQTTAQLTLHWPSGSRQQIEIAAVDRRITIDEKAGLIGEPR